MQLRVFLLLRSQRSHASVQLLVTAQSFFWCFPLRFCFCFLFTSTFSCCFLMLICSIMWKWKLPNTLSHETERQKAQISPVKAATLERLGSLRQVTALPHLFLILPYFWCVMMWRQKHPHIWYCQARKEKSNVRFLEISLIYWNSSKSQKLE